MYINPIMPQQAVFSSAASVRKKTPAASFCGIPKPFYLINEQGEYKRYENYTQAANDMNCYDRSISKCIRNSANSINGYYAVLAEDVERKDKRGNIQFDKSELMRRMRLGVQQNAVYSIDISNGSLRKYNRAVAAANEFNVQRSSISYSVLCNTPVKDGYIFASAKDIEQIDENGDVKINQYRIKEILDTNLKKSRAVYAIKKDGSYSVYETPTQAAKMLECDPEYIRTCMAGGILVKQQRLVKATEIEYYNENLHHAIDTDKIKKLTPR